MSQQDTERQGIRPLREGEGVVGGTVAVPRPPSGEPIAPHRDEFDGDFEDYDLYASDGCQTCGGEGFIVVCIDDMCRGAGECMHGDGEIPCPNCGGI